MTLGTYWHPLQYNRGVAKTPQKAHGHMLTTVQWFRGLSRQSRRCDAGVRGTRSSGPRVWRDHARCPAHADFLFAGRGPGYPDPRSMRLRASALLHVAVIPRAGVVF
jgi:hypothetical protein